MKNLKFLVLSLALLIMAFASTACSNNAAKDTAGQEYTAAYICPMHCTGSGSEKMGTCPVCKMDYVARAEHESNGHKHNPQ